MAIQVVDANNLIEFVKTGKVPEFKPPESPTPAVAADATAEPSKEDSAAGAQAPKTETPARNDKGQFTKPNEPDKSSATAATAGDDGGSDDPVDRDVPHRYKQQIDKKHRLWKEAEEREQRALRRAQEAERRAADAEQKISGQSKSQPVQPKELIPPKAEDFKSVAEYADAVVDFKLQQREAKEREQREADQKRQAEDAFKAKVAAAREKYDDFAEVVQSLSNSEMDQVPIDMIGYIQESDVGPDLLYHLAKHPSTLDRIRKLPPRRMFAELGKLEDKLGEPVEKSTPKTDPAPTQAKQPERQVSKAPAPIATLDTAGVAPVAKKPEEMSVTELREHRRQEAHERRAQGRA